MKRLLLAAALCLPLPALAGDLTLNDLPQVLRDLRGCHDERGYLTTVQVCSIEARDLWASISSTGELTLFRSRSYGDTTYAHGATVSALIADYARSLNRDQEQNAAQLRALAPYLPTN